MNSYLVKVNDSESHIVNDVTDVIKIESDWVFFNRLLVVACYSEYSFHSFNKMEKGMMREWMVNK